MKKQKPPWWPQNPYPEDIFPMAREQYAEIVPDERTRTALTGCLGRIFWEIASECIWDAFLAEDAAMITDDDLDAEEA
jgi:hypothetical protein